MTGKRGVAGLEGFEGAAAGRFSATPTFTEAFDAAFGACFGTDFGAGLGEVLAAVFAFAGAAVTAVLFRATLDFVAFGRASARAAFDAFTVEPEAFDTTGFASVDRFGTDVDFPAAAAAPFGFGTGAPDFAGLTATGAFFVATVFFPTSCRDLTDFSADFANGFETVDFFAATAFDGGAFDAAAFTSGFTLAAALPVCDDRRDLEVSLGVGFTGVFAAAWRLLAFAGEFLIESLCLSIL